LVRNGRVASLQLGRHRAFPDSTPARDPAHPPATVAGAPPRGGTAPPAALSPWFPTTPTRFLAPATPAAGRQAIQRRRSGHRHRDAEWRPLCGIRPPVEGPPPPCALPAPTASEPVANGGSNRRRPARLPTRGRTRHRCCQPDRTGATNRGRQTRQRRHPPSPPPRTCSGSVATPAPGGGRTSAAPAPRGSQARRTGGRR